MQQQAIHPNQIETIHAAFAPNPKGQYPYLFLRSEVQEKMLMADTLKAARIVFSFEHHDQLGTGAYELDGAMIDAPVYKQVCHDPSVVW